MRPFVLVCALVLFCCSAQQQSSDARIRSALDAFALAVDPIWASANAACAYQQRAIAADVRARKLTPDEGDAALVPVRKRCAQVTALLQAIAHAQDQAADLVEAGKVEDAAQWLEALRERWQQLGEAQQLRDAGVMP